MANAKKQTNQKKSSASSGSLTLTVVIIVLAVLLVGAVAFICVMLFGNKGDKDGDPSGSGDVAQGLVNEPEVDPETQALYDTPVMTVGDYTVTYENFRYYYLAGMSYYDGGDKSYWDTSEGVVSMQELQEDILRQMRYTAAINALCKKHGISLSDEEKKEIEDEFDAMAVQMQSVYGTTMTEFLAQYHMTLNFYKNEYGYFPALSQKLYDLYSQKDGEYMDFSDAAVAEFSEDFFHVKHILYEASDSSSEAMETAKAKAEAAVAALAAIEDETERFKKFDELLASDSADYHEGEDNFYYYTHGEMVEEFEAAVDDLAENEISGPVRTQYGYHVILRLPIDQKFFKENVYASYKFSDMIEEYGDTMEVTTTDFYASLTPTTAK